MTCSPRHIITLGRVSHRVRDAAVDLWHPNTVDQSLGQSESVLILLHQESTDPAQFIATLQEADRRGCPVGVIPVSDDSLDLACLARLLGEDRLRIDFNTSRFRLSGNADANLPAAPPVLRRANHDDPSTVAEDLDIADLLVLQGHAGPIDGGFGRWLTLCSRPLHQPGRPPFFPCFGTDQCFRQELHGRPATDVAGLVDPATLRSAMVVVDGCSTFPVPGSLYRYETSILRALLASRVRAAVMTLGVSATPLSVFVVFLAMLARGQTLGQAVLEANAYRRDLGSPSSVDGLAAAPWILVGNPAATVLGLPVIEAVPQLRQGTLGFSLDAGDLPVHTGAIVSLSDVPTANGPFDVVTDDGRWARGGVHRDGRAYLWVSGQGTDPDAETSLPRVAIALTRRPPDPTAEWRERVKELHANRQWLDRFASLVDERNGDAEGLRSLISLWDDVGRAMEPVAFAVAPQRHQAIAPPLDGSVAQLTAVIEQLDRVTALTVGAALPFAGARLSHLWSPPWLDGGPAHVTESCSCGCAIAGHVRRHAVLDLVRVQVSCPACSLVGDVSARTTVKAPGSAVVTPKVIGVPGERSPLPGRTITWPVQRLGVDRIAGFACAALFDPFRRRQVVTDAVRVPPCAGVDVPITIPDDWPAGLSWAAMIVSAGGALSLLGFDIVVKSRSWPDGGLGGAGGR